MIRDKCAALFLAILLEKRYWTKRLERSDKSQ